MRKPIALFAVLVTVLAAPVAEAADQQQPRLCGDRYCVTFAGDHEARIASLVVDGREVLDSSEGIYSLVDDGTTTTTSRELPESPTVELEGDTLTATFGTAVADETWTLDAGRDRLRFTISRTYRHAATYVRTGTPTMNFGQDAFDSIRWAGDGGVTPIGGRLLEEHQPAWFASGAHFQPTLRAAKAQLGYTLLGSGTALKIAGTTNHHGVNRPAATVLRRVDAGAARPMRASVATSASGLVYANGNDWGYGGLVNRDGGLIYRPTAVAAGQTDTVTLTFTPDDFASYYDLGTLKGVDETALSAVINDFARWMMQDVGMGASTEQPGIQTEVPPLEMHHIGELLELFPEPAAITSYQRGLDLIAQYLVDAETGQTRCCAPPTSGGWGLNYVDQETGFTLGVVKAYQLTGDDAWLRQITPAVTRALDYAIDVETDPTTRLVKNTNPDAGEADYTNDYWESSTGTYNGYASALLYDALTSWAALTDNDRYRAVSATLKASFNKDVADGGLWSPATHTFLYGSGNQDALYLPVNAQVLKTDIAAPLRRRQITTAIEAQNATGNYDLHPMNVRDIFHPDAIAPSMGKGGENGGWYGAPDGEFYAGLPTLGDPQRLQTAIASFLSRYQLDGFHGGSAWDRVDPHVTLPAAMWFPTTAMPAWGLYRFGYGFQPGNDRLVLAPYISRAMTGSDVKYTWRGVPMRVTYLDQLSYRVRVADPLPTPLTVRWNGQTPGTSVTVSIDGARREIVVGSDGTASVTLGSVAAGNHVVRCVDCVVHGSVDAAGATSAVTSYRPGGAALRNDAYDEVGMRIAVGPRAVRVTSLGRLKVRGNRQVHTVKILDAAGHRVVSAPVDMTRGADRRGFVNIALHKPVVLQPGIYFVYSTETPGGDRWYDSGGAVEAAANIDVLNPAYGRSLVVGAAGDTAYGPATFGYRVVGEDKPWLQAFAAPPSVQARSGGVATFTVTVWGQAPSPVAGEVRVDGLPAGWSADPASFTIPTSGAAASVEVPVTVHVGADAATADHSVRLSAVAGELSSSADVTVSVANVVYGFEDGTTQDWQPGPKVGDLQAVTTFANGPSEPYRGTYALQFSGGAIDGSDPRSIQVEPATPIDLSGASTAYVWVDSYGAIPGATSYQATMTLHSGDLEKTTTIEYAANTWNKIALDVGAWAGRSAITRIDVTFQIMTTATGYGPLFQIDEFGWDA